MRTSLERRQLLVSLAATAAGLLGLTVKSSGQAKSTAQAKSAAQPKPTMMVYKDPSCGCCQEWVNHATANGYKATVVNADMGPIKVKHQVPPTLQSCHTTLIGGYVIEGHVPASDVTRLLKERPKGILGLTIPGMPQSAPGMDVTPFQAYTVLTFDAKGLTTVYAKHTKPA